MRFAVLAPAGARGKVRRRRRCESRSSAFPEIPRCVGGFGVFAARAAIVMETDKGCAICRRVGACGKVSPVRENRMTTTMMQEYTLYIYIYIYINIYIYIYIYIYIHTGSAGVDGQRRAAGVPLAQAAPPLRVLQAALRTGAVYIYIYNMYIYININK